MESGAPGKQRLAGGEAGWSGIVEACNELLADMDSLVTRIIERTRREVPAYIGVVPISDQLEAARSDSVRILRALIDRAHPDDGDLDGARELGRVRAAQGLPVAEMLQAYHVAFAALWDALLVRVPGIDTDPAAQRAALGAVEILWAWVQVLSATVAQAHANAARAHNATQVDLRHRFFDALLAGRARHQGTADIARMLGMEPERPFRAVVVRGSGWSSERVEALQVELNRGAGIAQTARLGSNVFAIAQGISADRLAAAVLRVDPDATAGIGVERTGLHGAADTLIDAERAAQLAAGIGRPVYFSDEWVSATLFDEQARLMALFEPALELASTRPDLVEAVQSFGTCGLSITAAARNLGVHPNTLTYRLQRWTEMTGFDPRTFDGLVRSLTSFSFLRSPRESDSPVGAHPDDPRDSRSTPAE